MNWVMSVSCRTWPADVHIEFRFEVSLIIIRCGILVYSTEKKRRESWCIARSLLSRGERVNNYFDIQYQVQFLMFLKNVNSNDRQDCQSRICRKCSARLFENHHELVCADEWEYLFKTSLHFHKFSKSVSSVKFSLILTELTSLSVTWSYLPKSFASSQENHSDRRRGSFRPTARSNHEMSRRPRALPPSGLSCSVEDLRISVSLRDRNAVAEVTRHCAFTFSLFFFFRGRTSQS